jgi:hypothetical protein
MRFSFQRGVIASSSRMFGKRSIIARDAAGVGEGKTHPKLTPPYSRLVASPPVPCDEEGLAMFTYLARFMIGVRTALRARRERSLRS